MKLRDAILAKGLRQSCFAALGEGLLAAGKKNTPDEESGANANNKGETI